MTTLANFNTLVTRILQDKDTKISSADYSLFIQNEATQQYSKHRAFKRTADLTASSAYDYELSVSNFTGWSDGFSVITRVEYPAGNQIPSIIPKNEWKVYENASTKYLRFLTITPSSDTIRCNYITPHSVPDSGASTIYAADEGAFCNLAVAYIAGGIARWYGQAKDSTISADAIDYRDKSDIWESRSKNALQKYISFMFPKEIYPGVGVKEFDTIYGSLGYSRLTHPPWSR